MPKNTKRLLFSFFTVLNKFKFAELWENPKRFSHDDASRPNLYMKKTLAVGVFLLFLGLFLLIFGFEYFCDLLRHDYATRRMNDRHFLMDAVYFFDGGFSTSKLNKNIYSQTPLTRNAYSLSEWKNKIEKINQKRCIRKRWMWNHTSHSIKWYGVEDKK